jgi:putative oxidoreductase
MNREKQVSIAVFALRVVAGLLFLEYGGMKLFGWFGGQGWSNLDNMMMLAGLIEFFGGLALLLGLWVRPIAFVAAGEMAVAYFMAHMSTGMFYAPLTNDGTPAVLFAFIFLFFAAYGAGKWSLGKNR